MVTALAVPAFLLTNVPLRPDRPRVSPLTRPLRVPPVTVALVVASYTLLAATRPLTVKALGVMSPVTPVGLLTE